MNDDPKTPQQLIADGQALVRSLALGVARSIPMPVDLDDLIAYGQVGLAEAAREFDPQNGARFTTFAYYRVRGAIYDGVSKMSWTSRARYKRYRYELMANEALLSETESLTEQASLEQQARWFRNASEKLAVVYLASGGDEERGVRESSLEDPRASPSAMVAGREISEKLRQVVDQLPAAEQQLIRTIYFEGATLQEAADQLGISKSWAQPDARENPGPARPHASPDWRRVIPDGIARCNGLALASPFSRDGDRMATPDILDFDRLLRPISEGAPAGPELKDDDRLRAIYQAVKDSRETARSAEKKLYQATWLDEGDTSALQRPDWAKVRELASDVLENHSKDLWVASWLIEALTRLHGFSGLRDGFRLTRELVERFWDGIHPRPDEEGYATTVAQLAGLNGDESEGALVGPIDQIPITAAGAVRALSSSDYKHAVELDKLDPEKRAQRIERGAVSLEVCEKAIRDTSAEFYRSLLEDLQQTIDEFARLGEALEARCGTSPDGFAIAPPTSAIRSALTDVRDRVTNLSRDTLGGPEASETPDAEAGDEGSPAAVGTGKKGLNRDQAFRQLLQVADFFRRTEPHSPVSYALEQAVRWGRMSLPELLSELIADPSAREDLFKRVGLKNKESE